MPRQRIFRKRARQGRWSSREWPIRMATRSHIGCTSRREYCGKRETVMVNLSLVSSTIPYPDAPYGAVKVTVKIAVANEGIHSADVPIELDALFTTEDNHRWINHMDAESNNDAIHSRQRVLVSLDQTGHGNKQIALFFQDDRNIRSFPSSSHLVVVAVTGETGSSCRYDFDCDALEKVRILEDDGKGAK